MNAKPASYQCTSCQCRVKEEELLLKILSIMYRPKTLKIESFSQLKCPKCQNIVTIIFESLEA